MNRKAVIFGILAIFMLTFAGFTRPTAAITTCTTISGSYSAGSTSFISPTFLLAKGDTVQASATGSNSSVNGVGLIIFINGTGHPFQSAGSGVSGSVTASANASGSVKFVNNARTGQSVNWSVSYGPTCGQTGTNFTDGRVNSHDAAETAAIYCETDDSVTVWAVIASQGYFAFNATPAQIAKVPLKPLKNTLIKTAMNIALYRLTTGELQVNAPGNYVFTWAGCSPVVTATS